MLVAHERCLLDWVADMEAPSSRRRAGANAGKILCPQCKSEIHLQRPKNLIVDTVRFADRFADKMVVPGLVFILGATAYSTLSLAGEHAIYQIFGPEDGVRILAPLFRPPMANESSALMRVYNHVRHYWRLDIGLPLIPTALMASRTTVADSILPFLPLMFFASSGTGEDLLQLSWPPSAAFTIAALPYVRGIYNAYYQRVWTPREERWVKEVQPRMGEDDDAQDLHAAHDDDDHHDEEDQILDALADDGNDLENDENVQVNFEIDFEFLGGWNNGGAAGGGAAGGERGREAGEAAAAAAPPLEQPPNDHDAAAPAPQVPRNAAAAGADRQPARRQRNQILRSPLNLVDTVFGGLLFPSIAAAVGEALKLVLPASWVTPPPSTFWGSGKPTGFLQTRWGRSILGGCLFVGVKDAVMLYVRWKILQNHRKRRVLDYAGSKGVKRATGRA